MSTSTIQKIKHAVLSSPPSAPIQLGKYKRDCAAWLPFPYFCVARAVDDLIAEGALQTDADGEYVLARHSAKEQK